MSSRPIRTTENAAWARFQPRLSVVMPFFRYDPIPLLTILDRQASATGEAEIVALDDGGGDRDLVKRVTDFIQTMCTPMRLIVLSGNEGRAKGRNRLIENARARHALLIDCDMRPDSPDYLKRYLELASEDVPVAFGGFSVDSMEADADLELHRAMQSRAECLPAKVRMLNPEKYVYTSNLLMRRDVFQAEGFDEGFSGWGWEDVEWGMRVAARFGVLQIENTAMHLGLDTAEVLAGKYEQSVANFARVVASHPEIVATYPSYKMASALKRVPMLVRIKAALKAVALQSRLPLIVRIFAMKAYRAALYAEVV